MLERTCTKTGRWFEGSDATFGDVDARTEGFNRAVVVDALSEAERELEAAAEDATEDQLATIADLETVAGYLREIARAQTDAVSALRALQSALDALIAADHGTAADATSSLQSNLDGAQTALDAAREFDSVAAISAYSGDDLDGDAIAAKDAQLQAELDSFSEFASVLPEAIDGSKSFASGIEYQLDKQYNDARNDFDDAESKIANAAEEFNSDGVTVEYLSSEVRDIECWFETAEYGRESWRVAANYGLDGMDEEDIKEWEQRGAERLEGCDFELGLHPEN